MPVQITPLTPTIARRVMNRATVPGDRPCHRSRAPAEIRARAAAE